MDDSQQATAIAVIGYSGRFPGAADIETYWRNLRDGVESISRFTEEEAQAAGADPSELSDPAYVRAAGRLDAIENFDAELFGYSPREAELMDPQHRLFLESAWAALENAGYAPRGDHGAVGVWGGASFNTYLLNNLHTGRPLLPSMGDLGTTIGNDKDFLTTRVSYKLDLTGPSVAVQTACSTSLVAIAEACQGLLTYQCDMALAGGVNARVPQERGYLHEPEGIFSPDGHCRPFDARAAGTVFGNGVGVVVLKRLAEALEDRDAIRAVIRGFAINNDGAAKVGFTAPSVQRQAEVVTTAMAAAGVEPASVSCVEAHGTGTELGDPIEVAALNTAFGGEGRCALGSVKSNIGHLDAAAGVASFLKTVLALENRQLPPSLHFERPNPAIDFASGPFYVNAELCDWESNGAPRRAGVSSLGIGGTNAHVVLEEAPAAAATEPSRPNQLILLSARTPEALERASTRLADRLGDSTDRTLADVAYTLQVGRRAMPHRRALVCGSASEAADALRRSGSAVESPRIEDAERRVAFLFPGQGSQHPNMARGLYESEPEFRRRLDECVELLEPLLGRDLRELLFPAAGDESTTARQIERTLLAQPALFVVEYSLAHLWMSWGVRPEAMVGHSIGELVAACLAGVFTLPAALELIAARGKLMQGLPGGAMLAVEQSADQLAEAAGDELALAAVNAPTLCVVSGPTPAVRELEARLVAEGTPCRRLHTSHAFHSAMVDPVLDDFTAAVRRAEPQPPQLPFLSSLTGDWITTEQATDPAYWAQQMRQTVQFSGALQRLTNERELMLLEVGPGGSLAALARAHEGVPTVVSTLPHPNEKWEDGEHCLRALGRLWLAGVEPDWSGFYGEETRRRVPLPSYPFEPTRHWIEPRAPEGAAAAQDHPPKEEIPTPTSDLADWLYVPSWRRTAPCASPSASHWEEAGSWLLVGDPDGLAGRLAETLRRRGQTVTMAKAGTRFARLDDNLWSLNPLRRADSDELMRELGRRERSPDHVLFLTATDPAGPGDDSIDLPLYGLVSLVQSLTGSEPMVHTRLTLVTAGAHEVTGLDEHEPLRACTAGLSRSIQQEHPQIECRVVDLDPDELARLDPSDLERRVLFEALADDAEEQVAYRGRHRWAATSEHAPLKPLKSTPGRLRTGGVYLITGGLGGLGLAFAEHLAREYRAKLVITGRRDLPALTDWNSWLDAHPSDDPVSRRIEGIRRLESLGAEVTLAAVDVADFEAMRATLESVEADLGRVEGVLHAAGVLELESIQTLTPEAIARILRPKVQGLLVLDRLFRSRELDFLVLFSSLSTLVGGVGLSVYGAANSFLDAYATSQSGRADRRVLAIGWDTWREVGMATGLKTPAAAAKVDSGLSAEEGLEIFRRALESEVPRLIVSKQALASGPKTAKPIVPAIGLQSVDEPLAEEPGQEAPPVIEEQPPEDEPRTPLESELAERWQSLLGVARVGIHDNFFELGGHSLLATQLINRLRRDHPDAELSLTALFDGPTVADMAAMIEGESNGELQADEADEALTRAALIAAEPEDRAPLLTAYLARQLTSVESGEAGETAGSPSSDWHASAAGVAHLILALERDLELRTYPGELRRHASIPALAAYLASEIEDFEGDGESRSETEDEPVAAGTGATEPNGAPAFTTREPDSAPKNESAIFLLSCPRSGSTLLRVMLSGHSKLFCPPELTLLSFSTMSDWARDEHADLQREGLVRALAALVESGAAEAERMVDEMIERDLTTAEVYAELQRRARPRKLLDKTPIYAYREADLRRAEEIFDRPVYLHLTRHPYSVIDSFVRARFARLRGEAGDPHQVAERYWRRSNRNVLELARRIGRERCHLIQFEELVNDPEDVLRRLCAFFDLPFEQSVLEPYESGEMLAGPGDPKLFARGKILPEKADQWKEVELPKPVNEETRELARLLGYTV
jgi:acyl transferase domain-containing protein